MNLYPFEATAARADLTVEELIENIDIGGPAMVRSASKNFESVAVVTDPGGLSGAGRGAYRARRLEPGDSPWSWRAKRLRATARYDGMIATELERLSDRRTAR